MGRHRKPNAARKTARLSEQALNCLNYLRDVTLHATDQSQAIIFAAIRLTGYNEPWRATGHVWSPKARGGKGEMDQEARAEEEAGMRITFEVPDKDSKEIREAIDSIQTDEEVQKLNAVCFWLIKKCQETNAGSMTVTQTGVHQFGKELGDWRISVKKMLNK